MTLPITIAQATLDTVLGRLEPLFLTGAAGDLTVARQAASQMLTGYNPETDEELGLAAEIVSLRLHTLEALSYASDPELPLNKILRLQSGAVSLSREAHKSQRKLDQLQRARRTGVQPQPQPAETEPAPVPNRPKVDQALGLIEAAREAIEKASKNGGQTWTQLYQKRQTAKRLAKRIVKQQAGLAKAATHSVPSGHSQSATV